MNKQLISLFGVSTSFLKIGFFYCLKPLVPEFKKHIRFFLSKLKVLYKKFKKKLTSIPYFSRIFPLIEALVKKLTQVSARHPYKIQLSPTNSAFLPAVKHGRKYVIKQVGISLQQPHMGFLNSGIFSLQIFFKNNKVGNKRVIILILSMR